MAANLLTRQQAADIVGCNIRTIDRRIRSGELPARRSGRMVRIDPNDLDAMFSDPKRWA